MTPKELLQRWKRMSGDKSSRAWAVENTYGFLLQFRDDPAGLKKALPHQASAGRFDAAAPGGDDAYLVVRAPPSLTKKKAESLVRAHVKTLRTMARDVENEDAVEFLAQTFDVRLSKKAAPRIEQDSIAKHPLEESKRSSTSSKVTGSRNSAATPSRRRCARPRTSSSGDTELSSAGTSRTSCFTSPDVTRWMHVHAT